MHKYKIKSEKQSNGIWGMPMSVTSYDASLKRDQTLFNLQNAIIIAMAETHPNQWLKVRDWGENLYFSLEHKDTYQTGVEIVLFDRMFLENDVLYCFESTKEKAFFLRKKKLEKIYG